MKIYSCGHLLRHVIALILAVHMLPASANCGLDYSLNQGDALASCQSMVPAAVAQYGDGQWSCNLGNPRSYFLSEYRTGQEAPWCPSFAFQLSPPKTIVIDPGHGFGCAAKGMPLGTVGPTDFPQSDPPAGQLQEDTLTMAIALQVRAQASPAKFNVILTKASANSCPTYAQRGEVANIKNANAFVSIHVNAPALNPFVMGTSTYYNSENPNALDLADGMARTVSVTLGVNNRGASIRDDLAVLKPDVTHTLAVLIETARISGSDGQILHSPSAVARAAAAIVSSLEAYLGN